MHFTWSNDFFIYFSFKIDRMEGLFLRKTYDCVRYVKLKTQIDDSVLNLYLQQSKTMHKTQVVLASNQVNLLCYFT